MAATIEAVCPNRFGLNIVSGWYKEEFNQMGLWPGDDFFKTRYEYAKEYVTILKDLWTTGKSDFKGKNFNMNDAQILPIPTTDIPIVCAGQSDNGIDFTAAMGERNFVIAGGNSNDIENDIKIFKGITSKLQERANFYKRKVGTIALFNIIADETDEGANKRFEHIVDGADEVAITTLVGQAELDKSDGMSRSLKRKSMFMGLPTLVGSYSKVANYLDRVHYEADVEACMFAFPDFNNVIKVFSYDSLLIIFSVVGSFISLIFFSATETTLSVLNIIPS